jgi:O-antigen ligase
MGCSGLCCGVGSRPEGWEGGNLYSPIAFAVAVIAFPILTLGFGLAGSTGNGPITAGWLLAVSAFLILANRRIPNYKPTDGIVAVFVACCAISISRSFDPENWKEYLLLAICVPAPYLAGRLTTVSQLRRAPQAVLMVSAAFTTVASIVVTYSLYKSGLDGLDRTSVLGLGEAQVVFSVALGCLAISLAHADLPMGRLPARVLLFLVFVATMVLVASMVRFTILAMIASLIFAAIVFSLQGKLDDRKTAIVICVACLLGTLAATSLRPTVTAFAGEAVADVVHETEKSRSAVAPDGIPSCQHPITDEDRSVHLRAVLLKDALYLLPKAGLFGFGLNSFQNMTCLKGGYQIHNIFLQTYVELGFLAGTLLLILAISPFAYLRSVNIDRDCFLARNFLVVLLVFFCLLGLAHGSLSRALPIFLLIGSLASFFANDPIPKSSLSAKIGPTSC